MVVFTSLWPRMAQKFLHGTNVVAAFQELRGEGMPERVADGTFGQTSFFHRAAGCLLDDRFVNVMSSFFAGFRVLPLVLLREHPLPAPFLRRVGIFAGKVVKSGLVHLQILRASSNVNQFVMASHLVSNHQLWVVYSSSWQKCQRKISRFGSFPSTPVSIPGTDSVARSPSAALRI